MSESSEAPCNKRITIIRTVLILAVGIAVLTSACGFILSETEKAIVLRFGKPVRTHSEPGFYPRLPVPLERVIRIDRRLQHAEIRLSETLTKDQRNVIIPVFFTWRVDDPLRYHNSVGNIASATEKLDALITSARNSVIGSHAFSELIAPVGSPTNLPAIEDDILTLAAPDALSQLGIKLLSVGITRIQLPEANTESVFRRMRAERKREATKFRAEGRAQSVTMKAETDREATRLLADAKRQAEEIRGEAEAEAAALYAAAHGSDPEFYRFLRELQSLRTIVDKNTTLVLDTSVAPLHWLKNRDDPQSSPSSPPPIPKNHELTQSPFLNDKPAE
ncbi:protease modulator HflC [Haloferula chungangensis]|uniref:Protein HflC n=1 Tax=Haloferula chungangensis TaxID=1048331 RepID=A0ABW2L4X4_9BACT